MSHRTQGTHIHWTHGTHRPIKAVMLALLQPSTVPQPKLPGSALGCALETYVPMLSPAQHINLYSESQLTQIHVHRFVYTSSTCTLQSLTHLFLHSCLPACTLLCTYLHTSALICTHMHSHAAGHTPVHICTAPHICTHSHTNLHSPTHLHTRSYINLHSHTLHTHTHTRCEQEVLPSSPAIPLHGSIRRRGAALCSCPCPAY